jgi:hypothetical protein
VAKVSLLPLKTLNTRKTSYDGKLRSKVLAEAREKNYLVHNHELN